MKDFIEQLNDWVSPIVRAYSEPQILRISTAPGDIKESEAEFTLVIRCKRIAGIPYLPEQNLPKHSGS